ncbi:hypothetical protein JXQ31_05385 [candidate division KSB1 bacterium]|nr:hypothetical protein [candidate division KSB1 bacterium]
MDAIILAATHERGKNANGRDVPIVLLDLGEDPLLTLMIKKLIKIKDLHKIFIVTNEKIKPELDTWFEQISRYYPDYAKKLKIVSDGTHTPEEKKGAVGDLLYVIEQEIIKDDIIIIGGDNWFTFDLQEFVNKSKQNSPAVLVTSYRSRLNPSRFGLVELDRNHKILKYQEKPEQTDLLLKASCVYYINSGDLYWLKEFSKRYDIKCSPGTFFSWLTEQTDTFGVQMDSKWYDVGDSTEAHLHGPDFIKIRELVRKKFGSYSTWENEAARRLQWISSYEDVIDALRDDDINLRIVAANILGDMKKLLDKQEKSYIINKLKELLADGSQNQIDYGGFQSDEDEVYYVSATAAGSMAKLGYADNIDTVFAKAKKEGLRVSEMRNV